MRKSLKKAIINRSKQNNKFNKNGTYKNWSNKTQGNPSRKTKKKSTLKTSLIANISAKTFFLRKKLELSRCVVG